MGSGVTVVPLRVGNTCPSTGTPEHPARFVITSSALVADRARSLGFCVSPGGARDENARRAIVRQVDENHENEDEDP